MLVRISGLQAKIRTHKHPDISQRLCQVNREEQKENLGYDFYYDDRESKRVTQKSNRFTCLE
jgi:hypothetical protein